MESPSETARKTKRSVFQANLNHWLSGARRVDRDTVEDVFPKFIDDDDEVERAYKHGVFTSSLVISQSYQVKIITKRHVRLHQLLVRWRNRVLRTKGYENVFKSYDTPGEMADYITNTTKILPEKSGALLDVIAHDTVRDGGTALLMTEYNADIGSISNDAKNIRQLKHITETLHDIHKTGYTHGNAARNIIQTIPHGEPYLSEPVGRHIDTEAAKTFAIGFDLACILAHYSQRVGALPAIRVIESEYDVETLVPVYLSLSAIPFPKTKPWVIKHIGESIDEILTEESIDNYIDEFDAVSEMDEYSRKFSLLQETPDATHKDESEKPFDIDDSNTDDTTTNEDNEEEKQRENPLYDEEDNEITLGLVSESDTFLDGKN